MGITSKRLKLALLSIIILLLCAVIILFVIKRQIYQTPEALISAISKNTDMSIKNFTQVSTKNGKKEWALKAEYAHLIKGSEKAVFNNLSIVFFLGNGSEATLSAKKGELDTKTGDLSAMGSVFLKNGPYTMTTEKLLYFQKHRMVESEASAKIAGHGMEFSAAHITFDLTTKRARLRGNVQGTIDEKL